MQAVYVHGAESIVKIRTPTAHREEVPRLL